MKIDYQYCASCVKVWFATVLGIPKFPTELLKIVDGYAVELTKSKDLYIFIEGRAYHAREFDITPVTILSHREADKYLSTVINRESDRNERELVTTAPKLENKSETKWKKAGKTFARGKPPITEAITFCISDFKMVCVRKCWIPNI